MRLLTIIYIYHEPTEIEMVIIGFSISNRYQLIILKNNNLGIKVKKNIVQQLLIYALNLFGASN